MILSVGMMLKYSFNLESEAAKIEEAVNKVLNDGYVTADLMSEDGQVLSTMEMTDKIISYL